MYYLHTDIYGYIILIYSEKYILETRVNNNVTEIYLWSLLLL